MNKLFCVLAVILYVGSAANVGFAQSSEIPSNETLVQWEMFKADYGSNWTVRWHGDRNIPRRISGKYQLDKRIEDKGEAEAVAWEIITSSKDILGIDEIANLKLKRVFVDKFGFIPEYGQLYKGIPVYGGEVRVTLSENEFEGIGNNFYPGINISTKPKITREEAIKIVETEIDESREIESTELYIVPKSKNGGLDYRLTWRVYVKGAYFFVDALNGEIIHKESTVVANDGISSDGSAVKDEVVSEDTVTSTPAQTEGPSSSSRNASSTIFVALAALTIAAMLIIWRWKK